MKLKRYFLNLFALLLLASCTQEEAPGNSGFGTLAIEVLTNHEVIPVVRSTAQTTTDGEVPDTKEFSLKLVSNTGDYTRAWETLDRFDPNTKIPIGDYTVSAFHGNLDQEGFDLPYFYGESQATVLDHENTPVDIECALANVKVTVEYTDAFKNFFTDWSSTIQSTGGKYIDFSKGEARAAYVKPGDIKIQVHLKKQNGISSTFEPATIQNALPQHHYKIKFDVEDNFGNAEVSISFDESTETQPIRINISDDVMVAPAPSFLPTGFQSGIPVEAREFSYATEKNVNLSITAKGGLAGCTLTTTSTCLLELGWPNEVDLLNLTDEQRNTLTQLGLVFKGFNGTGNTMALIDFTEVFTHLQVAGENDSHLFTISARDNNGKVSESPITLSVKSLPILFTLQAPESIYVGSTSVTLPVQFNGSGIDQIEFSYLNEAGERVVAPVTVLSNTDESYQVKLDIQASNKPLQIEGSICEGRKVETITIPVVTPPFTITAEPYDIWAKKATITLTATDPQYQAAVEKYVVLYSNNGDSWNTLTASGENGVKTLTGLTPNTSYQLRGTCNDGLDNTNYCETFTLQTEAATNVPNGDFETLAQTINTTINQGGTWTHTTLSSAKLYQTTLSMIVSEPTGWASVNAKTCNLNASNLNSWYVIPSTFNTTLSWLSHQPEAKVWGLGQSAYDSTADIYQNLTAQSGSNAMVVRNVAWDNVGATIETDRKTGNPSPYNNYYCSKIPAITHRSAGKLFLGSYSYNDVDNYNEGVSFESRPNKLEGYYKYALGPDASEKATVTVTLMNGETVIATASAELGAASDYTKFSLPISYTEQLKATHLRIMISSSNYSNERDIQTTNYSNKEECCSRGAMLTIDNLTFIYE